MRGGHPLSCGIAQRNVFTDTVTVVRWGRRLPFSPPEVGRLGVPFGLDVAVAALAEPLALVRLVCFSDHLQQGRGRGRQGRQETERAEGGKKSKRVKE